MGNSASSRIRSLDGLRGIAALVVVLHHSLLVIPAFAASHYGGEVPESISWFVYSPLHAVWAGTEAVYVFFVLSGIVLTLPVLRSDHFSWQAYFPSRMVRLYVPVAGAVLLALALALLVAREARDGQSEWLQIHIEPITPLSVVLDAVLLLGTDDLNSPLWSLRWEVIFSLMLPAYVWLAARFQRVWWMLGGAAIALTCAGVLLGASWLIYPPMFMLGCVLATRLNELQGLARRVEYRRNSASIWWVLLVAALLGITARWWLATFLGGTAAKLATPIVLVAAVLLVVLTISSPRVRAALDNFAVQWIGRVSFSLYLTHEPIVVSIAFVLPPELIWMTPLLAIPLSMLAAWLFFRVVEAPAHHLAKRVAAMRRPRSHS
jgi:peptidoglycan/LPS O-acetylase OafA/YrhL